eukprot:jgi/Bigna1/86632/estExt_fgenesh1_pg.C_120106
MDKKHVGGDAQTTADPPPEEVEKGEEENSKAQETSGENETKEEKDTEATTSEVEAGGTETKEETKGTEAKPMEAANEEISSSSKVVDAVLPGSIRALVERAKYLDEAKDHFLRSTHSTLSTPQLDFEFEATSPQAKYPKNKFVDVAVFLDPYPYRDNAQQLPPLAKRPKKTNWFGYKSRALNMGVVMCSTTAQYKYKITVKSRYLCLLHVDVSFRQAPFIHGSFKKTVLEPGGEHHTIVSFFGKQKPGEKTGYITVRSFCDYGEETIKVPVFCRVIKAEASKGNKGILGIPKHAVKLIQKTGKLSNSTNLAFNTVESRAWN